MTHCCQAEPRVCSRLHPMIQTEKWNQIHAWTKTTTMEPRLAKHIVGARCQNVIQLFNNMHVIAVQTAFPALQTFQM